MPALFFAPHVLGENDTKMRNLPMNRLRRGICRARSAALQKAAKTAEKATLHAFATTLCCCAFRKSWALPREYEYYFCCRLKRGLANYPLAGGVF